MNTVASWAIIYSKTVHKLCHCARDEILQAPTPFF